jgi:hypothetical protein
MWVRGKPKETNQNQKAHAILLLFPNFPGSFRNDSVIIWVPHNRSLSQSPRWTSCFSVSLIAVVGVVAVVVWQSKQHSAGFDSCSMSTSPKGIFISFETGVVFSKDQTRRIKI